MADWLERQRPRSLVKPKSIKRIQKPMAVRTNQMDLIASAQVVVCALPSWVKSIKHHLRAAQIYRGTSSQTSTSSCVDS